MVKQDSGAERRRKLVKWASSLGVLIRDCGYSTVLLAACHLNGIRDC